MSTDRTYARFYYPEFIHDYGDVYADDVLFAAWMRLFVRAEQMWPLPVELPRSIRPKALAGLVERGLVIVTGDFYAIKGMEAERTRRRDAARKGAAVRWDSDGNANASPNAMPRRDETRRVPPTPTSGGRRSNGTNPRSVAAKAREERKRQSQAIRMDYYAGRITEGVMNERLEALRA